MKLQPSLLDRLVLEPPADERVLDSEKLRAFVIRDLTHLISTTKLPNTVDLEPYPEVASSVLNYGIPDLVGRSLTTADHQILEAAIRRSVRDFEPRIDPQSLRVAVQGSSEMNRRALAFEIEGEVWGQPFSLPMYLRTELDLETGSVSPETERRSTS